MLLVREVLWPKQHITVNPRAFRQSSQSSHLLPGYNMSTATIAKTGAKNQSKGPRSWIVSLVGGQMGLTSGLTPPLLTGVQCQGPTIGLSLAFHRTDPPSSAQLPSETAVRSWAAAASDWAGQNQLDGRVEEIGSAVASTLQELSKYANRTSNEFPRSTTTLGGATVSCQPPSTGAEDTYGVLIDVKPWYNEHSKPSAAISASGETARRKKPFILYDDSDESDEDGEPEGTSTDLDLEGGSGSLLRRSTAGSENLQDLL